MRSSGICRVAISGAEGQRAFGSNYSAYSLRLIREHSLSGARNSSKQSWCSQLYKRFRCHPPSICWIKDGNNMQSKPVDRMVQTWWFYAVTAVIGPKYSAYSWTLHILEYALHCIFEGMGKNSRVCIFHPKPATDSTLKPPPIPVQSCHLFHSKTASYK